MIPLFLHMVGFHCDSKGNVMSTSVINLVDNIQLARIDPREQFNSSKYTPYKFAGVSDCTISIRYVDDNLYHTCSDGNATGCIYALLTTQKAFSDEAVCLNATNCSYITLGNPTGTRSESNFYCFTDAYRKDLQDINWFNRYFSCTLSDCVPPEHYYWESSDGTFTCANLALCGANATKITYTIDNELKDRGAVDYYGDKEDELSYENTVRIKCTERGQPKIFIFKIDIFDYKIWLLLFVLGMLFYFLSHIKNH
jgi:hypothetical protein